MKGLLTPDAIIAGSKDIFSITLFVVSINNTNRIIRQIIDINLVCSGINCNSNWVVSYFYISFKFTRCAIYNTYRIDSEI